QECLDFRYPAVAHIGDVDGMVVVALVGCLVGELHRIAEVEIVLRADLGKLLEPPDARDPGQRLAGVEKGFFLGRAARMLQAECDGVTDHAWRSSHGPAGQVLSAQARMRWWAIAPGGGVVSVGC